MDGSLRKLDEERLVIDMRAGTSDERLAEKYGVSPRLLAAILDEMVDRGLLSRRELEARTSRDRGRSRRNSRCPACRRPVGGEDTECSACGLTLLTDAPDRDAAEKSRTVRKEGSAVRTGSHRNGGAAESQGLDLAELTEELIPLNATNVETLKRDFAFWAVAALGVFPLIIAIVRVPAAQAGALVFFFAGIWGVLFKKLIVADHGRWTPPILAFAFTSTIGVFITAALGVVIAASPFAPDVQNPDSLSLIGFIMLVGVPEEFCKVIPALFVTVREARKGAAIQPRATILLGIFSGLGFAASENIVYLERSVLETLALKDSFGSTGVVAGVHGSVATTMLRSLSCVFVHAVWSGLFAYFIAAGFSTGRPLSVFFPIGLAVSAVLHGAYDWLCVVSLLLAALTAGGSFMLFYAYVSKTRWILAERGA